MVHLSRLAVHRNSPDCLRDGRKMVKQEILDFDISGPSTAQICVIVGPGKTIESTNTVLKQTDLMFGLKRR